MKRSYSEEHTLVESVFDLLEIAFPGLRRTAKRAARLGGYWESVSTPFLHFESGRLVSHVGIIELPLVLMGRAERVGTLHAVATHPDCRRRGYFRQLMEEVIEYSANRYNTLILTTENPEYYEPFGFRVLEEHLLTANCASPGGVGDFRALNTEDPGDIALLNRLLDRREPVSEVVGVAAEKAVFCFNEGNKPLYYCGELDVMLSMEMDGSRLNLFDVVAPKLPSLEGIVERWPATVDQVNANFATDRFTTTTVATKRIFDHDGPSYFMARGPFAAEGEAFTMPRSART
jgi:predicted N-acetyltransferase YhbS